MHSLAAFSTLRYSEVVITLDFESSIPGSNPGIGIEGPDLRHTLSIAQLVERWTVAWFRSSRLLSIGHPFDSGSRDFC